MNAPRHSPDLLALSLAAVALLQAQLQLVASLAKDPP